MRLALAIASLVVLIVHGVVFYDQFFNRWETAPDRLFRTGARLSQNDRERAALEAAQSQASSRSSSPASATRAWIAAPPATSPATIRASLRQPSRCRRILIPPPWATCLRNGRWERRHKFSDFGCTVCHDGQGRGLETVQPRRRRILARPAAGLRDAGQLAQGFRLAAEGQGVHGGQLRAVPHRQRISPARPHVNRGRKLFYP